MNYSDMMLIRYISFGEEDRSCHLCGDMVPGDNLAHHMRRKHDGSDEGTAEDPVSRRSSSGCDLLNSTFLVP